jgi:hypothetical protein
MGLEAPLGSNGLGPNPAGWPSIAHPGRSLIGWAPMGPLEAPWALMGWAPMA